MIPWNLNTLALAKHYSVCLSNPASSTQINRVLNLGAGLSVSEHWQTPPDGQGSSATAMN